MLCGLGQIPRLLAALLFHPVKMITGAPTHTVLVGKTPHRQKGTEGPEENLGAGAYRLTQVPIQPCSPEAQLTSERSRKASPGPPSFRETTPKTPGPLQELVRSAFLLRVVGHGVPKERQKGLQGKGWSRSPPDFCLQGPSCSCVEDSPEGASVGENGQASSQQGEVGTTLELLYTWI